MPTPHLYDYAVIRVVPRVEREEFINVGVIVSCPGDDRLEARIELDEARLHAFAPGLDIDALRPYLQAIEAVCRGDRDAGLIASLPARARFHWLTAKRSSIVQVSPAHMGSTAHPERIIEHLLQKMVRMPE